MTPKKSTKQKQNSFSDFDLDTLLDLQNKMMLIRRFEESTIKGYQQKKIAGFLHTYIGQEAVGVGTLAHKQAVDSVITTYRCHGLGLAMGMDPNACMAELYGKITGVARGKGGSMHFFSKEHNFLGGHGIVGGQFGPGIGAAFENKYNENGGVSFIHFGDGAIPQGTFHECLNLASLWDLPAIFICEDNQYAMGTATERILSNREISEMGAAYKVKGYKIDGMNLIETYFQMKEIIAEVRKTNRPVLVHMLTYRFKGHSVSDAALYRTKDEENEWKAKDPIVALNDWLIAEGHKTEEEIKEWDKSIKKIVADSIAYADNSPFPPLEELAAHTYFDDLETKQWQ